jgi:hypothetical protein
LIPLPSMLRALGTLMTSLLRRTGRATTWLPWLGVALVVAAVLSPGTVTASLLAFQSPSTPTPVPPTPVPPPPTPTPVPPAPPTETPVPPAPPTETPVQPPPVPPTQAPPATAVPSEPTPTPVQPPPPTLVPTMFPTPVMLPASTPTLLPPPPPLPPPTPPQVSGSNQPIVNWVKFWDTIAVTLAYPWLCCGVGLILLVPVVLLFLEIKGRRAPPRPPEPVPERMDDEE